MPISNSDSRWVWELDPKRPFGELTKYTGNRQVTNLPLVNFTNAGALPTNDGVNQIHERVLDPHGSGEYVYRTQIRADRADGDGSVSGGYANGTFRSEISNTLKTPQWGVEYWCAFAVMLGSDFAAAAPNLNIAEFHVPSPNNTPVGVSPIYWLAGNGVVSVYVRHNVNLPTNQNDYTTAVSWSAPSTLNVWHYFISNFKLGADSTSNFFRMWHKVGDGPLNMVVNYTGRIGYWAACDPADRYNYAKHGMYWYTTWPASGSPTRTMWSKGFRLIREAAGTPEIDEVQMLMLLDPTETGEEPPPPIPDWSGVTFPSLAAWVPQLVTTYDAWVPIAATAPDATDGGGSFDPVSTQGEAMLIKQNESTAARRTIYVQLTKTADDTAYTTALGAADLKISKAGGAEASSDGTSTHLGGGVFAYVLTIDEVGTLGAGYVRVAQADCYARVYPFQIVAFDPMAASNLGLSNLDTTVSSNAPANMATALLDLADGIETGMTPRQALRFLCAIAGGQTEGADTNSEKFLAAVAAHKIRATVTLVGSDRSSVAVDLD